MNKTQIEAMKHSNKLGAGAMKRKNLKGQEKVGVVMHEFKRGTLHSGSGGIVKDREQAVAIAMSEAGLSKQQKKSTKGSPEMTGAEMIKGYRSLGKGLPVMDGKPHATENRGEGY
jgi:hypothetical protein